MTDPAHTPQFARQEAGRPDIAMPDPTHTPDDYVDGPSSTGLANIVLEYTYSRGNRYRLSFDGDGGVTFQMLDDGSEARGPLPYRARELRSNQYLIHWLVKAFGVHVAMVVDLDLSTLSVAAMMPPGSWEFFDQATDVRVVRTL